LTVLGIAEYATGMIDESQRFFDVALPVSGFRIIFADQAAQRGTHLLVRGGLWNSERFVKRCFHWPRPRAKCDEI